MPFWTSWGRGGKAATGTSRTIQLILKNMKDLSDPCLAINCFLGHVENNGTKRSFSKQIFLYFFLSSTDYTVYLWHKFLFKKIFLFKFFKYLEKICLFLWVVWVLLAFEKRQIKVSYFRFIFCSPMFSVILSYIEANQYNLAFCLTLFDIFNQRA